MLSLCKAKYNFTDDILSGMWLPFVQIKGNYYKNLLFESFIHTSVWSTIIIPSTLSKVNQNVSLCGIDAGQFSVWMGSVIDGEFPPNFHLRSLYVFKEVI
jgi:hypothetical protein